MIRSTEKVKQPLPRKIPLPMIFMFRRFRITNKSSRRRPADPTEEIYLINNREYFIYYITTWSSFIIMEIVTHIMFIGIQENNVQRETDNAFPLHQIVTNCKTYTTEIIIWFGYPQSYFTRIFTFQMLI